MDRSTKGQRGIKLQVRRFNLICQQAKIGVSKLEMIRNINQQMGMNFSKSTYEKDMKLLKDELSCPLVYNKNNKVYTLTMSWSFLDALSRFANATEPNNGTLSERDRKRHKRQVKSSCTEPDNGARSERDMKGHERQVKSSCADLNHQELDVLSTKQEMLIKEVNELELKLNATSTFSSDFDEVVSQLNSTKNELSLTEKKIINMVKGKPVLGFTSPFESVQE